MTCHGLAVARRGAPGERGHGRPAGTRAAARRADGGTAESRAGSQTARRPNRAAEIDGGWPRDYATPRPAGRSASSSRRWRAGTASATWWPTPPFRTPQRAPPSRRSAPSRSKRTRSVAIDERLVNFTDVKLTESHFADLPNDQLKEVVATINAEVPRGALVIALDRVLARLDKSQIIPKNVAGVKADPPVIFSSTSPAVLVNLDGDPIWSPIKDNDLKFAVNTNWDLFEHVPTKTFYLRNEQSWLSATSVKGPWKAAGTLPGSFTSLPADDNWKEVRAALPGRPAAALPKVFVSTTPAELILMNGAPNYLPVSGTQPAVGVQHRERRLPAGQDRRRSTSWCPGRWFTARRFRRPVDVRHARTCRTTSRRFRCRTRDRACSPRCRAPTRPPKRCCSRRFRRRHASPRSR